MAVSADGRVSFSTVGQHNKVLVNRGDGRTSLRFNNGDFMGKQLNLAKVYSGSRLGDSSMKNKMNVGKSICMCQYTRDHAGQTKVVFFISSI